MGSQAHWQAGKIHGGIEQVLKSLIHGGEDAADLEVHVRILGQEL